MGSEERVYNKFNDAFNDYILETALTYALKFMKGLEYDDAAKLANELFTTKEFKESIQNFEFRVERSANTDSIVALKDALAFIPEVGAVLDIGIDSVTKILPQLLFISTDGYNVTKAIELFKKHTDLIDEKHQNIKDQKEQSGGKIRHKKSRRNVKKSKRNGKKSKRNVKKSKRNVKKSKRNGKNPEEMEKNPEEMEKNPTN